MIKRLRRRFVLLSMTTFALVLAVLLGAINIVNYNAVVREADMILDLLKDNRGEFPAEPGFRPDRLPHGMSPEIPYESRYFTVTVDPQTHEILRVNTSRVVAVNEKLAVDYAVDALSSGRKNGFEDQYRYQVRTEGALKHIFFLDCGRKLGAFRSFLVISVVISLVGYGIVLAVITFFSGRIVKPISESYEKQRRFITDAGHELKTPLTIIRADAQVLEETLGDNEWLADIQRQTQRLSSLTNDLILLSRMEEGQKAMTMIEFSFSDVICEVADGFHQLACAQEKILACEVQPLLTLKGNEKAFRQLVEILLDNAIKYSPRGGTIRIRGEKQGKTLRLEVSNATVHTLAQEELDKLFERFYRTDPSRNSQTGGYGIGLSVAKAIISAHGGRIQVTTPVEKEIKFTAVFPI